MLASLILVLIPGPAVMYIVTRGVTQGRAAAVISTLGVETGMLVHIGAAAAGVSALIARTAVTFTTLKLVGAAYLIWLAVAALRHREDEEEAAGTVKERSMRRLYVHGFAVSALNPKVAVFFLAFFPQFVDPSRGSILSQTLMLGGLFLMIATLSDLTYALLSGTIGTRLHGVKSGARWSRYTQAGVYAALAVAVATTAVDTDT